MRYLHDAGMGMNMLQHERPFRQAVQQTALAQEQQRILEGAAAAPDFAAFYFRSVPALQGRHVRGRADRKQQGGGAVVVQRSGAEVRIRLYGKASLAQRRILAET